MTKIAETTETMMAPQGLWHSMTPEESCAEFGCRPESGLDRQEAARRVMLYGKNTLPEEKKKSAWQVLARQFISPLIYILFVAATIAFAMGKRSDAAVILVVVVINAIIGAIQEGRAERSMKSLRNLAALKVRVRRNGREESIEAKDLVPGDVLLLAAGDAVGADARLLEAASLQSAEAALTGESLPVNKKVDVLNKETLLADRRNMVFSGTNIVAGRGTAVVTATGLNTEVGKIARLTTSADTPKTPLEQRIAQFGRYLVWAAIGLVGLVMTVGLIRGLPFSEVFMVAVSQMVSMVPEGLPVAMTIALAVGMQRMASRKAIVRRLAAVETLGSTSVICSDKTGTLTKNEMTVTTLWLPGGREFEVTGTGYLPEGWIGENGQPISLEESGIRRMLEAVVLCNDADLMAPDESRSRWQPLGDPTEAALLTLAMKGGLDLSLVRQEWPRSSEIPFDSAVKMMATEHGQGEKRRVVIKGAPEMILKLCGFCLKENLLAPLSEMDHGDVAAASGSMASRALRLLAVAEVLEGRIQEESGFEAFQGKAVFLGLIGQMDPPREEVAGAVAICRAAGIRPVMVTGDHKITGMAIAQSLGISQKGDQAVDGAELEQMSAQQLQERLDRISVFARVHPSQKLRIVEAFQARKKIVAMTGDGVNDAPALAAADIGVAMGITGTEVAKGAAKIIISDDNFATIVNAIEEGRLVYRNLKKVVLYLFTTSIAEIVVLLSALFLGYPLPLAAVQILWINLVTEGTVTVNLIMEPPEGNEMRQAPISRSEGLITRNMIQRILFMMPTMALCTFGYFVWRLSLGKPFIQVQSETFTLLAVCQWFNVLNCRSELNSSLNLSRYNNYWLLGGLLLGNLLHFLVIYTEPMNRIFHTVPIPLTEFFLIGAVASTVLWVEEIRKFFARRKMVYGT